MAADQWMLVGRVAGAFGVRGELRVELHTDFPDRFKKLREVFIGSARTPFRVEGSRRHAGQVLLKLEGVDTPERVREMAQSEIFIPRTQARRLPRGHFYLDEVLGLEVRTVEGEVLGPVTDVLVTGSNEVFVVRGGEKEFLIPVIKDAIETLDIPAGVVVVHPWVLETA